MNQMVYLVVVEYDYEGYDVERIFLVKEAALRFLEAQHADDVARDRYADGRAVWAYQVVPEGEEAPEYNIVRAYRRGTLTGGE